MRKLATVVLLLLLLSVVFWLASRPDSAPQTMPEMVRFNPTDVFSITLEQGAVGVISLLRSDEKWQLVGDMSGEGKSAADAKAVQHLLDDLASMEIIRVVTRNPKHYKGLNIDSAETSYGSVQVTLKEDGGKTLLDLLIGKQGSDLISTYLRVADRPEVLAVNRVLLWQVRRSYQGWKAAASKPVESDVNNEQQ
ncbi:MAG: DUF4340 domain-containing protein [Mariprofundaceae bacterium]